MTGTMSSKGSKTELIALKTPLFVSGTTLFEALNLSISIIASQVFTSTLYVSNSSRSKLTTFEKNISRDRFLKYFGGNIRLVGNYHQNISVLINFSK